MLYSEVVDKWTGFTIKIDSYHCSYIALLVQCGTTVEDTVLTQYIKFYQTVRDLMLAGY